MHDGAWLCSAQDLQPQGGACITLAACVRARPPPRAHLQPAQLLCGIAERGAHVHLMSVYRDPFSDGGYDDNISLSLKLPVREDSLYGPE